MPWPWIFLAVTLVGALFTFNAYLPQRRTGPFIVPSFFAGWLTSELSAHHFAWQLVATGFFVWAGALSAWPGWLGLGITLASWAGLLAMVGLAHRSAEVAEQALCASLGPRYRERIEPDVAARMSAPAPRGRLALPFRFFDPEVAVTRDLRYAEGFGRRRLLDVYAPREGARGAPVLFQIHGGAWMVSEKRHQALPLMMHLAARGWVCVAANYRLAPRASLPDPIVDLKLALAWIRAHVAEFGGDPDFVAATGGSAGGHLSSLMALTANDPELQPGFERADTRLQACVPFYGVYDFTNRFGHQPFAGTRRFAERMLIKRRYADHPELFEKYSPLYRVRADAPPFFVIHGTHDSLAPVGEARSFVEALRAVSHAPVAYAELPGAQHAFEVFHGLRSAHVVRAVDRFLASIWSEHRRARAAADATSVRSA
jgi:acetyl esterase/lipase